MLYLKGYYSLVQYCPDRSRGEAVNIGVVLFSPEVGFLESQISPSNQRIAKFFGRASFDADFLAAAKSSFASGIELAKKIIRNLDDFVKYIESSGNDITMTYPRPIKISDPEKELKELFEELVGRSTRISHPRREFPVLDRFFLNSDMRKLVRFNETVIIPVVERQIKFPYAFLNQYQNLVRPKRFYGAVDNATANALLIASEGKLIWDHSQDNDIPKKQVVIPFLDPSLNRSPFRDKMKEIFEEFGSKVYFEDQIPEFLTNVKEHARLP